jgi:hypothetical protein
VNVPSVPGFGSFRAIRWEFIPSRCQFCFWTTADRQLLVPNRERDVGGWPGLALHHSHGGCPILAFIARVGGDAAGATFVRSTLPLVYAVVVPALRKVREGRGTRSGVASAV